MTVFTFHFALQLSVVVCVCSSEGRDHVLVILVYSTAISTDLTHVRCFLCALNVEWMDGWVDGWIGEWMNGWMSE